LTSSLPLPPDQPNPTKALASISTTSLASSAWRSAGDAGLGLSGSWQARRRRRSRVKIRRGWPRRYGPTRRYSRAPFISAPLSSPLRARRRHLAGLLPPLLHRFCVLLLAAPPSPHPRRGLTTALSTRLLRTFLDEAKYTY
jgi:hypothetical protein